MQFTTRCLAFAAAISQALAAIQLTNSNYAVTEGQAFTITWTGAEGDVTVLLKDGSSTDLKTVQTIASGETGTSFTWTPTNLPSDTYAFEITDGVTTNYSPQFTYQGTGTDTTTTSETSLTATSTTSSSTSSAASSSTTTTSSTSTNTTSSSSSSATAPVTSSAGNTTSSSSSTGTLSTSTRTSTGTSTSSSTATSTPVNTNNGQKLGSPLALIALTAVALLFAH